MLEIGNGGMKDDEYRTAMSLWSILAAPLLAGNDLRNMTPAILEILTNREVIAINQDKDGKQGRRMSKSGEQEVWARPLSDGGQAIGLFNRSGTVGKIIVSGSDLALKPAPCLVRDFWAHTALRLVAAESSGMLPPNGVWFLPVPN